MRLRAKEEWGTASEPGKDRRKERKGKAMKSKRKKMEGMDK